jgi:hypothetical protein
MGLVIFSVYIQVTKIPAIIDQEIQKKAAYWLGSFPKKIISATTNE